MLQIRLSKGGGGVGAASDTGAAARPSQPSDAVNVACPDHLVIADLPVAKSLGAAPSSAVSVRSVGRRSRRHLGERVHICVCCDFPIAIYGRLIPCEHAFCLTCARSEAICYLCEERIQKIQTIKMLEGLFICAAPHCLKSFLKRPELESHIHELHSNLLQSDVDREGINEAEPNQPITIGRPSSTDSHAKQSAQPESSTARAPTRPGFSPSSNSQLDREDRSRCHQSREPTPMRPPMQPMPSPFHNLQQPQQGDVHSDNKQPPPGMWFHNPQSFDHQINQHNRRDADQMLPENNTGMPSESPYHEFPPSHPFQMPNYPMPMSVPMPMIIAQGQNLPAQFSYPPPPVDGSQPYYNAPFEMLRAETMPESGQEHGSVLGFMPVPAGPPGFTDPQQWNAGFVNMQFESMPAGQVVMDANRANIVQAEYGGMVEGMASNPNLQPRDSEMHPGSVPLSLPPPPPLPLPAMSQQHGRGSFSGSGEGPT